MKIADHKPDFEKAVEHLRHELATLRTGRATPAILDNVMVEAYGAPMNLKGVGSISMPDNRTLLIEPWDKGLLKEIEKAIIKADIGIQPIVDGTAVRLSMPRLNEENRRDLVKIMNRKLEEGRVAIRSVREKVRASVIEAEKNNQISEDDRFGLQEELEKLTALFSEEIKQIGEEKEKEIMTI